MAMSFTGTGGLLTRIGRVGRILSDINTYQNTTITNFVTSLMAQYQSTLTDIASTLPPQQATTQAQAEQVMSSTVQKLAEQTILTMVKNDNPAQAGSLASALQEVVTQMKAQSVTIKTCTVACTATAISGSTGNGAVVTSTKRGDGLTQENIVAETGYLVCTSDAQTGGATAGQEKFTYTGAADGKDAYAYNWPTGSGASTAFTAIDATKDNSAGNLLTNSDFELFTSHLPNKWVAVAGVAGTDFAEDTTHQYSGTTCLKLVGGGTAPDLSQVFNDTTNGTAGTLSPDQSYAVNLAIKADVVPAAGVLTVELVDGTGTVINDDQAVANSFTVTISSITTSYVMHSGVFRLPKALPATVKIRLRVSTGITAGSNVFIDHLAMGKLTACYDGGPGAAVFSGSTNFIKGDGWTLGQTNDRGGSTLNATFQALFDRLFAMRAKGLLLPSSGTPTAADTLITS